MLAALVLVAVSRIPAESLATPLQRMEQAFRGHRAVQMKLALVTDGKRASGSSLNDVVRILAPDCFSATSQYEVSTTDGTNAFRIIKTDRTWRRQNVDLVLHEGRWMPGYGSLLRGSRPVTASGPEKDVLVDGEKMVSVPINDPISQQKPGTLTLLLDPKTWLPSALVISAPGGHEMRIEFRDIVLDPPLQRSDFSFVPPAGWQEMGAHTPIDPSDASPNVWVPVGRSKMRIGPMFRQEGKDWVIDLQAQSANAYDWTHVEMVFYVDQSWRHARFLRRSKDGTSATFAYTPRRVAEPPNAAWVKVLANKGSKPITIVFNWVKRR